MLNAGIMDEEEFEDLIKSKKVCICDFSASWCGPCRMLAPILEDVSEKYKKQFYFYKIDVDSAEEIAEKYNVIEVPTIVIFESGKEIGRTSGYQTLEDIENFILSATKNS